MSAILIWLGVCKASQRKTTRNHCKAGLCPLTIYKCAQVILWLLNNFSKVYEESLWGDPDQAMYKQFWESSLDNRNFLQVNFFTSQPRASVRSRLALRLLCRFCVCMCVRTYHVCNNYVTYIVARRSYRLTLVDFGNLRWLFCVAAMSSLSQLRLRDGYRKAEAT